MISIVIDNTRMRRCDLYVYALTNYVPAFAIEGALRVVRDAAISLRLDGAEEAEARAKMQEYVRRIVVNCGAFGADVAEMERLGDRDVEEFLRMARSLRPQPIQRPNQGRTPFIDVNASSDVIDVEFEVIEPAAATDESIGLVSPET